MNWIKAKDPFTAVMAVADKEMCRPQTVNCIRNLLLNYTTFEAFVKDLEEATNIVLEHNHLLPGWRAAFKE